MDRVWERTDLSRPAIGEVSRDDLVAAGEVLRSSGVVDAEVDVRRVVDELIAPGFGAAVAAPAGAGAGAGGR